MLKSVFNIVLPFIFLFVLKGVNEYVWKDIYNDEFFNPKLSIKLYLLKSWPNSQHIRRSEIPSRIGCLFNLIHSSLSFNLAPSQLRRKCECFSNIYWILIYFYVLMFLCEQPNRISSSAKTYSWTNVPMKGSHLNNLTIQPSAMHLYSRQTLNLSWLSFYFSTFLANSVNGKVCVIVITWMILSFHSYFWLLWYITAPSTLFPIVCQCTYLRMINVHCWVRACNRLLFSIVLYFNFENG